MNSRLMNAQPTATLQHLILIPTPLEQQLGSVQLDSLMLANQAQLGLCGLGLVQAGVNSMQLIQSTQPQTVWLLGIAGTYADRLQLASAYEFSQVACYGIGVGSGSTFRSSSQLGWAAALGDNSNDFIRLNEQGNLTSERLLISSTAASADASEAELKLQAFPTAVAEDMESYAVAVACRAMSVPLRVVRGISNRVGDRDHSRWQSAAAMRAAIELTGKLMKA
jgi:futalosine hydrolase